jgi:hypothetical protein
MEVGAALRKRVEADLADSVKIELARWKKRSLFLRSIERFVYALRCYCSSCSCADSRTQARCSTL